MTSQTQPQLYNELDNSEYDILENVDRDLVREYNELQEINNTDLSYNEIVNKYAKILYFWSNKMPDFGDIDNGDINATFKWLFIQNKIIQNLRRVKRFKHSLLGSILERYVLLTLTS